MVKPRPAASYKNYDAMQKNNLSFDILHHHIQGGPNHDTTQQPNARAIASAAPSTSPPISSPSHRRCLSLRCAGAGVAAVVRFDLRGSDVVN